MNEREQQIRKRAHQIWEEEGCPQGREREHWERAEREINAREGRSLQGGIAAEGGLRLHGPGLSPVVLSGDTSYSRYRVSISFCSVKYRFASILPASRVNNSNRFQNALDVHQVGSVELLVPQHVSGVWAALTAEVRRTPSRNCRNPSIRAASTW